MENNKISLARMNEIVVSTKDKPIIATHSLATCIGLIIHDKENYVLAHLSDDFDMILQMLSFLGNAPIYEAIIIPGYFTRVEKIKELEAYLNNHSIFKYVDFNIHILNNKEFINEEMTCVDIAYDTRTKKYFKPNIEQLLKVEGRNQNGRD